MSWIGGLCHAIPATARNPGAAWELTRFLASPRARRIMAESQPLSAQSQGRIYVPSQSAHRGINEENFARYVRDNPVMPANLKEALRVFNNVVSDSRFRPPGRPAPIQRKREPDRTLAPPRRSAAPVS